jgi:pSer/pThr/pTyr-binding forkhead associated (FHA) protein
MTAVLGQWRATYAAGDWVVLAGPTSLVVLQPLAHEWSAMISTLWDEVLASSSMATLATKLAGYGIEDMPHFGAFFWTPDGMRSLVRGAVRVLDPDTGRTLADGEGVQTWAEVGLGDTQRIRIETPATRPGDDGYLPLLVGAVRAATITLDAATAVSSPQGDSEAEAAQQPAPAPEPAYEPEPEPEPVPEPAPVPPVAEVDLMENGDTQLMQTPLSPDTEDLPSTELNLPEPVVARIILSDGSVHDLDRQMRIGRAPVGEGDRLLVTVISPNQDISRTHVQLTPWEGEVWVTDLHSTNGTMLVRPGAESDRERLPAGDAVPVPLGSLLELGDGVSVLVEPPHQRLL